MDPANLLALMQTYQGAQNAPSMAGPIAPQQLAPGFRAPPQMNMQAAPQPQQLQGLGGGFALPRTGSFDPNGYYNNLGGKPGGYSSIDDLLGNATHVANPAGASNGANQPLNFNQAMDQAYTNMGGTLPQAQSTGWQGLGNFFRGLF